jgi:hypothetical protein
MYLLYLDESGDTGNWQEQNNFVIAGIGIYEFRLKALKERIREVQNQYFPNIQIPVIFHATDIHSGNGMFRKISLEKREQLLMDLYGVISENRPPNVSLFGAVMSIDAAKNPYKDRSQIFEEVICGFNSFLVEGYRLQQHEGKGSNRIGNKGLVIIDENRKEQYRELLDRFQEEGTSHGYLANIIDIPYFARCNDTPMLQLADLCAYALFRNFERSDSSYLNVILPHFFRTHNGQMFGFKHITNLECDCPACLNAKAHRTRSNC